MRTLNRYDRAALLVARVFSILFAVLLAWASLVTVAVHVVFRGVVTAFGEMAFTQSRMAICNAGYSPASNTTGNLPQTQAVYYEKTFIENLKAETPFVKQTRRMEMPENSGNQLALYEMVQLGANTQQAAEGVVGSGITVQVIQNRTTMGNYADYLNYSKFALQLAIDPALENGAKELGYRLARTLSNLVRFTADGYSAIDASVNEQNAFNVPFNKSNITSAIASLSGRNVKALTPGRYGGIIHPFGVGDTLNDTTYNSLSDILKHTIEGQHKMQELPSSDDGMAPVIDWAGCRFMTSTEVTMTPNYLGHAGVTALRTYIFGENGIITVSLGKKEGAQVGDGDWRNLKMYTKRYDDVSVSDPAGMIGGSTAYNVNFVPTVVPDTTGRIRTIDAPSNIS
jgi:N4-gp56 family major capsid protein